MQRMGALGILKEVTGRERDRVLVYEAYVRIMSEGTETLPRFSTAGGA